MTGTEFKAARKTCLKMSQQELSEVMDTPKRTIQDIEACRDKPIRGVYRVCIGLLVARDAWSTKAVLAGIERSIDREFPQGIVGEVDEDGEA